MENNKDAKRKYKTYVTCPYCGHQDREIWDRVLEDEDVDKDTFENECVKCGREFKFKTR